MFHIEKYCSHFMIFLQTKLAIEEANRDSEESIAIAKVLLPYLKDRQKMRKQCLDK